MPSGIIYKSEQRGCPSRYYTYYYFYITNGEDKFDFIFPGVSLPGRVKKSLGFDLKTFTISWNRRGATFHLNSLRKPVPIIKQSWLSFM